MSGAKMKTVCIDLDGTLAKYDGWKGVHSIGEPFPFAKEWLEDVSTRYRIVIHTCRTNLQMNGKELVGSDQDKISQLVNIVKGWFHKHDLRYDHIWCEIGKPPAEYYIDDRAIKVRNGIYPEI